MKPYFIKILVTFVFLTFTNAAHSIILSFDPTTQSAAIGDSVDIGLEISGLGALSPSSLGAFDIDVSYDSSILAFSSVAFGDPILGDQLDLFSFGSVTIFDASTLGIVNLLELSFDFPVDLDTLQAGAFTLAVLTFDTLAVGSSLLDISSSILSDSFGDSLSASIVSGNVTVPEPTTIALFGLGMLGMFFSRRRARSMSPV